MKRYMHDKLHNRMSEDEGEGDWILFADHAQYVAALRVLLANMESPFTLSECEQSHKPGDLAQYVAAANLYLARRVRINRDHEATPGFHETGKPLLGVTAAARRNDRSKIYLTVDTNYGGIITPDGTARLLPCEVCEQCFWVPVNTVSMTCDPCATGPFTVGRSDTTGKITRHATLAEAEAQIVEIEKTDPEGVHAGDYYVDGPEELINPPAAMADEDEDADIHEGQPPYDEDDEPEDSPTCPICEGPGVPLGTLGRLAHFKCRNCGIPFYHDTTK